MSVDIKHKYRVMIAAYRITKRFDKPHQIKYNPHILCL